MSEEMDVTYKGTSTSMPLYPRRECSKEAYLLNRSWVGPTVSLDYRKESIGFAKNRGRTGPHLTGVAQLC